MIETKTDTEAPGPIERRFMDAAVRPCDNFYEYANGAWLRETAIPDDESGWGGFHELRDRNFAVLHTILDDAARDGRSGNAKLVGDLYASGMDEAGIARAGLASVSDVLARVAALRSSKELASIFGWLQRRGVRAGLALRAMPDAFASTRNIVHLMQGGLGLPDRDYYLKDDEKSRDVQEKYRAHIATMFTLLGDSADEAGKAAAAIYDLEHALATAAMARVEQRDPYKVNNPTTRAQLDTLAPGFDWAAFFTEIGARDAKDLNVRQPEFFSALATLARERPIATWRAYLRARVIDTFAPYLAPELENAHFDLYGRTLVGQATQKARWKRVLEIVDSELGEPLGQLYVERAFPPEAKQRILDLVADLRAVLRERIADLEWMGEETKNAARTKLDAFAVKMGYPDKWRDFSGLKLERGPLVDNVIRATTFNFDHDIAKLGRPVDRDEWLMSAPTVNAYYYPPRNEIVFPAGILQPPFFFADADAAVNYGAVGMVIGHEMTHGFDDQGSQFDEVGNLRNWWQESDRAAYSSRTDLVVQQYEGYEPLPGTRINGKLCLGENIADFGGLKIAFAAFERYLAREGEPAPIDGFSARQRFFMGYAQSWRSKLREQAERMRLTIDPHSPGRYRVLGPLANLPEFFEAFGCEGGEMARPKELRPTIW
ncbi:MAG TPA: M13 family metallopeptidase [Candidatus Limnocylindrales bacterium]|nr:M13 family metallopeptidase [Candidatus Limnocylindrales bacterium]